MTGVEPTGRRAAGDEPTGRLVSEAAQDMSTLVSDELALAKVELAASARAAGIGAGLFGGAGLLALYGVGALVATAILALALVVDAWAAALIVSGVLFAAAGVAALVGKREVGQASPPLESTKDGVRHDLEAAKGHRA